MIQARGTPAIYFKALNRQFNVLGVDRELFFLIIAICLPIAVSAQLLPIMDFFAALAFIVLHAVGVLITRADNQMLAIYRRHIHYKKYYAAYTGIHAPVPLVKPSVPVYEGQRGFV